MDDIMGLLSAPYSERSGDGTAARIIRMMLQRKAMALQERSLEFQNQSKQQNKATSLPPQLQQQQAQPPEQEEAPMAQEAPEGDIGVLL